NLPEAASTPVFRTFLERLRTSLLALVSCNAPGRKWLKFSPENRFGSGVSSCWLRYWRISKLDSRKSESAFEPYLKTPSISTRSDAAGRGLVGTSFPKKRTCAG